MLQHVKQIRRRFKFPDFIMQTSRARQRAGRTWRLKWQIGDCFNESVITSRLAIFWFSFLTVTAMQMKRYFRESHCSTSWIVQLPFTSLFNVDDRCTQTFMSTLNVLNIFNKNVRRSGNYSCKYHCLRAVFISQHIPIVTEANEIKFVAFDFGNMATVGSAALSTWLWSIQLIRHPGNLTFWQLEIATSLNMPVWSQLARLVVPRYLQIMATST